MGQYFDNQDLPSKMVKREVSLLGDRFIFYTDNGVFSKDGLDFGSRFLLESIPLEEIGGKILDMGCGYGVFGIILSRITGNDVDMVDVNLRALHLAKRNCDLNNIDNVNVFESNCYENVKDKYAVIITNPPIRAGKKIVYEIVMGAREYLEEGGCLFLVIRKEQGAKSLIRDLGDIYKVDILNKKSGYYAVKCSI